MRKLIAYGLLLLLLLAGALFWNFDQLVQQAVRPWLIEKMQKTWQAEVRIESLEIDWQHLLVRQVNLSIKEGVSAQIAEIEVRFNVRDLLQRHLTELVVRQAEILVRPAQLGKDQEEMAGRLPDRAPLQIDRWSFEGDSLRLILPDRQLNLHAITAQGSFGPDFKFETQALLGEDPAVAFQVNGTGEWRQGLAITLSELLWDEQSLLPEAVTFKPGAVSASAINLSVAQVESASVEALLLAVGEEVPWPEGMPWQMSGLHLSVQQRQGELTLHVTTQKGFVRAVDALRPWQQIDFQATGMGNDWHISALVMLAAESQLLLSGQWQDRVFVGEGRFSSDKPVELAHQLALPLPVELKRIQQLTVQTRFRVATGEMDVEHGRFDLRLQQIGRLQGTFTGQWQGRAVTADFDQMTLTQANQRLADASLRLSGNLDTDSWQGQWSVACAEPLPLAIRAGFDFPAWGPHPEEIELAGNLSWQRNRLALTGVNLQGNMRGDGGTAVMHGQMDIAANLQGEFDMKVRQLTLSGLEYTNAAGTVVAVGGQLDSFGSLRLDERQIGFKLQGQASLSEALLGSWYGELSGLPVHFVGEGNWDLSSEALRLDRAEVDLAGLAAVFVQGRWASEQLQLQGHLEINRLAGNFQETLQRLGADLLSGINQLELSGGLFAEAVLETHHRNWSLNLSLRPREVMLAWGESFRLTGLRGSFPVQLRYGDSLPAAMAVSGILEWDQLKTKLVETSHGLLQLEASANRWNLKSPLEANSVGGKVRLSQLLVTTEELNPQALASVQVSDLELAQLARVFGWPEMSGRLNASLDDIQISRDEIVTTGKALGEVFEGSFQLRNLKIKAPFSRYPTYHADIDFSGLDLYELTKVFAFGEINGVVDGFVHGLRLFRGIPSAFEGRFETRSEGTRNISVKAIRNLNTLSQGGLSSALSRGIYQFIDFYRFRKIGLVCSLQKDLLHISGVARPGSDQYLIYGGMLPPKIDVIMSSPTISFKEMVQRLKRIERTER